MLFILQLARGKKTQLCNNSVLEISGLKFVFLINQDLIEAIRKEAIRQEATKFHQTA